MFNRLIFKGLYFIFKRFSRDFPEQFRSHVLCLFGLAVEIFVQKIREEKDFQDTEHDEQLYQDDNPERFSDRHGGKAVAEKQVKIFKKIRRFHE